MWWNTEYIPATHLGNIGARNLQDPFAEDIIDLWYALVGPHGKEVVEIFGPFILVGPTTVTNSLPVGEKIGRELRDWKSIIWFGCER